MSFTYGTVGVGDVIWFTVLYYTTVDAATLYRLSPAKYARIIHPLNIVFEAINVALYVPSEAVVTEAG